jgi:hypothetical protein
LLKQPVIKSDSSNNAAIPKPDSIKSIPSKENIVKTEETPPAESNGMDQIVRRNGQILYVKYLSKNIYEIQYKRPGDDIIRKISTANVKEIRHSNGKIDLIDNNLEKKPKDWVSKAAEQDWAKIQVFTESSEISGFSEKGSMEAEYVAKKMEVENELLEKNVIITLKKKAFTMKANAILIVDKKIERNYGELPLITMKAIAYIKE